MKQPSILLQSEHNLKFLQSFGLKYLPFPISNVCALILNFVKFLNLYLYLEGGKSWSSFIYKSTENMKIYISKLSTDDISKIVNNYYKKSVEDQLKIFKNISNVCVLILNFVKFFTMDFDTFRSK
jgi:hypothetical protein